MSKATCGGGVRGRAGDAVAASVLLFLDVFVLCLDVEEGEFCG